MGNKRNLLEKARAYAFLLLKFRLRSEREIYARLKQKKFDDEVISQTISFLRDKGFVDDKLFAKTWIDARLKKPLGLRRIKQELNLKGIDKEIIETQLCAIKNNYPEKDIVTKITQERIGKLKGIDPGVAKRRVYAYLLRRGFSPEVVMDAINQLCKQIS